MTDLSTAKTILNQIFAADRWALGAWGSREMVGLEAGVIMKVSGTKFKGKIEIQLDYNNDTYTVRTYKANKVSSEMTDVYAEQLVPVLDSVIG